MYEELLKKAQELWPKRSDLSPRTMREDAMLRILCKLIDDAFYAKRFVGDLSLDPPGKIERATRAAEYHIGQALDAGEKPHRVVARIYDILTDGADST